MQCAPKQQQNDSSQKSGPLVNVRSHSSVARSAAVAISQEEKGREQSRYLETNMSKKVEGGSDGRHHSLGVKMATSPTKQGEVGRSAWVGDRCGERCVGAGVGDGEKGKETGSGRSPSQPNYDGKSHVSGWVSVYAGGGYGPSDPEERGEEEEEEYVNGKDQSEDPYQTIPPSHREFVQRNVSPGNTVDDGEQVSGIVREHKEIGIMAAKVNSLTPFKACANSKVGKVSSEEGAVSTGTASTNKVVYTGTCSGEVNRDMRDVLFEGGNVAEGQLHVAVNGAKEGACEEVEEEEAEDNGRDGEVCVLDSSLEIGFTSEEDGEELISSSGIKVPEGISRTTDSEGPPVVGSRKTIPSRKLEESLELQESRRLQLHTNHPLQALQDALSSTHPDYAFQLQTDGLNFSLQQQNRLASQLMAESCSVHENKANGNRAVCEQRVSSSRSDSSPVSSMATFFQGSASLKELIQRIKEDQLNSYLPNNEIFQSKQPIQNCSTIGTHDTLDGTEPVLGDVENLLNSQRNESRLLKVLEPYADVTEDRDVDNPAIVHKLVSRTQSTETPSSVVEDIHLKTTVCSDLESTPLQYPPRLTTSNLPLSPAVSRSGVSVLLTSNTREVCKELESVLSPQTRGTALSPDYPYSSKITSTYSNYDLLNRSVISNNLHSPIPDIRTREQTTCKGDSYDGVSSDKSIQRDGHNVILSDEVQLAEPLMEGSTRMKEFVPFFPTCESNSSAVRSSGSYEFDIISCELESDLNQSSIGERKDELNSSTEEILHSALLLEHDNSICLARTDSSISKNFNSGSNLPHLFAGVPDSTSGNGVSYATDSLTLNAQRFPSGPSGPVYSHSKIRNGANVQRVKKSRHKGEPPLTTKVLSPDQMRREEDTSSAASEKDNGDLCFLVECFPDLDQLYLQQVLAVNGGNVENTIAALLSPPTGLDHNHVGGAIDFKESASPPDIGVPDLYSGESLAGRNATRAWGGEEEDKTDVMGEEEEDNTDMVGEEEKDKTDMVEESDFLVVEDNLMMTLTTSLAQQLQALFGPVDQHLPLKGEEELLLSLWLFIY